MTKLIWVLWRGGKFHNAFGNPRDAKEKQGVNDTVTATKEGDLAHLNTRGEILTPEEGVTTPEEGPAYGYSGKRPYLLAGRRFPALPTLKERLAYEALRAERKKKKKRE